jgi:hypothetical protein
MPRCSGSKPDGSPCERIVGASQEYCYSHDPNRAQERHRAASKAARSKPNRELINVKDRLRDMIDGVYDGTMDRGDAAVCGQLFNALIRAIGMELKVKEVEELTHEIEEIRGALQVRKKRRWG